MIKAHYIRINNRLEQKKLERILYVIFIIWNMMWRMQSCLSFCLHRHVRVVVVRSTIDVVDLITMDHVSSYFFRCIYVN